MKAKLTTQRKITGKKYANFTDLGHYVILLDEYKNLNIDAHPALAAPQPPS